MLDVDSSGEVKWEYGFDWRLFTVNTAPAVDRVSPVAATWPREYSFDDWDNGTSLEVEIALCSHQVATAPLVGSSVAPGFSCVVGHMIVGAEIDGTFVFHLGDALSTVRDVVDDTGAVIKSFEFDEYGNLLDSSGTGTTSPKTWIGGLSVNDDRADSGMFNMSHRNYAAGVLGRFISRDPIGHRGGLNLYSYTVNPVRYTDSNGLDQGLDGEWNRMGSGPSVFETVTTPSWWLNEATLPGPYGNPDPSKQGTVCDLSSWNDTRSYTYDHGGLASGLAFDASTTIAAAATFGYTSLVSAPVVSMVTITNAALRAGLPIASIPILEGTAGSLTADGYVLVAECGGEVLGYERAIYLTRLGRRSIQNGVKTIRHELEHIMQAEAGVATRTEASEAAAKAAEETVPKIWTWQ